MTAASEQALRAPCAITPDNAYDPWISTYVGCISIGIMWSILAQLVCGVAAVACAFYAVSSAVRLSRLSKMGFPHRHDYAIAMTVIALVHATTVSLAFVAWYRLMKPSETWQTDAGGNALQNNEWTIDSWYVFVGGLMFSAFAPLAVALCVIERTLCCPKLFARLC